MTKNIKILYISSLCSPSTWDYIYNTSIEKPVQTLQKFHGLHVEGLSMHKNQCDVETLGAVPVTFRSHKKIFWAKNKETVGNIEYGHIPFVNLPGFKEVCLFVYTIFKVLFWRYKNRKSQTVAVCNVLNLSISLGALIICKITRTKIIAIATDIPGLMIRNQNSNRLKTKIYNITVKKFIKQYSAYVLITKQMNKVVNTNNRPYIIMEGLVDIKMNETENRLENKSNEKILMYSGGIYEQYGIKKLIDAFMKLPDPLFVLHIYGWGEMAKEMPAYCEKDNRIIYKGIVPNQEVVNAQIKATLLINPRPTSLELAEFSFPSKNMEYMVSGTPMITTALPGMPNEYLDFVYLINDESTEGIYTTLNELISRPKEELHEMGLRAKQFVLKKKNNYIQAKRLLDLVNELN